MARKNIPKNRVGLNPDPHNPASIKPKGYQMLDFALEHILTHLDDPLPRFPSPLQILRRFESLARVRNAIRSHH
ncbi:hypothetical protein TorRG33x02_176280 [Trema orientale]|uniref:Uncharacterized protein n=1 Tax=Trema orientale TaxID=63057 RepID=A0A2P5ELY0_TREOI|nr:hypothetical protein TorRG33x02_176280 [Trema orientale]